MLNVIKSISKRTVNAIKKFKENPISNLAYLVVIAIVLTATISGIISYIMFIVKGGYVQQIELVKNNGLDGISDGFTKGTIGEITSGLSGEIMCGLVLVEFIVMLIRYFINSNKTKRVILIIDLILCVIVIGLFRAVVLIIIGKLTITEQDVYKYYKYLSVFEGMKININVVLITYLVVAVVSLITFLVLILTTKECRWMIKYTVLALLFSNIAIPFFFLMIENIIPIIIGIIVLVTIGLLIFFLYKISGVQCEDTSQKGLGIPYFNSGYKLWKVHGWHDYIAIDDGMEMKKICSLKEYENGEFCIYESETERKIESSEIPWK